MTKQIFQTVTLIALSWRRFQVVATITSVWLILPITSWCQESAINLHQFPSDISIPPISDEQPNPGKRVRQRNTGYEDWNLYHVLYLPIDWKPDQTYPIIAEYPGNGGYKNKLGDESLGRPEDCKLGYGATKGKGVIWVSLPFVDTGRKDIRFDGGATLMQRQPIVGKRSNAFARSMAEIERGLFSPGFLEVQSLAATLVYAMMRQLGYGVV